MEDEVISWKFVEENYPDFENCPIIKERLAYVKIQKDTPYNGQRLIIIYQKSMTNYMNKKHAELKNKEIEKDLEGFI